MNKLLRTLTASVIAFAASAATYAATEMRCSHQLPPGHHIAKVIDRWATEVESASGGELDVQIFGANSLVGARENIVSTAEGDIECAFSVNFQWGKTQGYRKICKSGEFLIHCIISWQQRCQALRVKRLKR